MKAMPDLVLSRFYSSLLVLCSPGCWLVEFLFRFAFFCLEGTAIVGLDFLNESIGVGRIIVCQLEISLDK